MSATTTTPSIEEELSKCAALVASFIGDIKAAGEAIARACDSYDHFLRELKNKLGSNVTITYLRRLERLGRGEICEQIAIGAVPHISFVEKLPRTQQIEVIKNGVKFPEGLGDHRFLRLEVMDYYQAKAAFKGKVIGSLDEIRVAYLAINEQRAAKKNATKAENYRWKEDRKSVAQKVLDRVDGIISMVNGEPVLVIKSTRQLTLKQVTDLHTYMECLNWHL